MTGFFVNFLMVAYGSRNKENTGEVKRVVYLGLSACLAFMYVLAMSSFVEFRSHDAFKWITPFVFPINAFIVRYLGQRTMLTETTVSKLGTSVSAMSAVMSRASQCYYLHTYSDLVMFFVLEVFYDVVGILTKVTLHHRQMLLDGIMSGVLWRDGWKTWRNGSGCGTSRNHLISSQAVVHTCVIDLMSFITMFACSTSILSIGNKQEIHAGVFVGVFLVCVLLQIGSFTITNTLVRRVDAVLVEDLDIPVYPLKKLWTTHLYYVSAILTLVTYSPKIFFEMWFHEQSTRNHLL
eukprot:PhF_6_TR4940/c0_g1_i2/m.7006